MKYWMIVSCLLLAGCGDGGPKNIAENADQKALAEYEAAMAEADKMANEDTDFQE